MANFKSFLFFILIVSLFASCTFINNAFLYNREGREFVNDLLKKDYDSAIKLIKSEHDSISGVSIDTFKKRLPYFRNYLVSGFGDHLSFTFINIDKQALGNSDEPLNSTQLLLQYDNGKFFGVFKISFDDETNKIVKFNVLNIRNPIPNMTFFWLFGLLAICVPLFNIYVIVKIKRSKMKRKWLGYLAVIVLNVTSIIYTPIDGLSFSLPNFHLMLGIGFSLEGYSNAAWVVGIPLGGLFMLWWLRYKLAETPNVIIEDFAASDEEEKETIFEKPKEPEE